jgi:hypothetical protein
MAERLLCLATRSQISATTGGKNERSGMATARWRGRFTVAVGRLATLLGSSPAPDTADVLGSGAATTSAADCSSRVSPLPLAIGVAAKYSSMPPACGVSLRALLFDGDLGVAPRVAIGSLTAPLSLLSADMASTGTSAAIAIGGACAWLLGVSFAARFRCHFAGAVALVGVRFAGATTGRSGSVASASSPPSVETITSVSCEPTDASDASAASGGADSGAGCSKPASIRSRVCCASSGVSADGSRL